MPVIFLLSLVLAGCGVADVGSSAATAAKLKADQVKQGQETAAQVTQKLEAANQAAAQRAGEEADKTR